MANINKKVVLQYVHEKSGVNDGFGITIPVSENQLNDAVFMADLARVTAEPYKNMFNPSAHIFEIHNEETLESTSALVVYFAPKNQFTYYLFRFLTFTNGVQDQKWSHETAIAYHSDLTDYVRAAVDPVDAVKEDWESLATDYFNEVIYQEVLEGDRSNG